MRSDRHGGEFSSRVDRSLRLRAQCQRAEPESTSRAYRRGVLRVGLRRHHQEDGPERRASLGFGLLDLGETQHGRDGSRSLRPSFLYHAVVFARKHPACPGSRDLESATHLGGVKTRTHRHAPFPPGRPFARLSCPCLTRGNYRLMRWAYELSLLKPAVAPWRRLS